MSLKLKKKCWYYVSIDDAITGENLLQKLKLRFRCILIYSEPHSRPSFQELVDKLKEMQRQCAIQHQAERAGARDATQK